MGQGNLTPYGIKTRQTRESTPANEINHGLHQRVSSTLLMIWWILYALGSCIDEIYETPVLPAYDQ